MTDLEAAAELQRRLDSCREADGTDHKLADAFLCELLRQHGYTQTIAVYEALHKWYE